MPDFDEFVVYCHPMAKTGAVMESGSSKSQDKREEDILLYAGRINQVGHGLLRGCLENGGTNKVRLILVTRGGDAHAAYRMAQTMRRRYKIVEICVPSLCKSAGTLLCIGADSLVICDEGELGPLDVQYPKTDELGGLMSGLNIIQAMVDLRRQTIESFNFFLRHLGKGRPTNQMVKIATDLTRELIGPIAGRIDPIMLGTHNRGIRIAFHYGERLNSQTGALKDLDALNQLIALYPSHETVIDRDEAKKHFTNVNAPDQETLTLLAKVESGLRSSFEARSGNRPPIVRSC